MEGPPRRASAVHRLKILSVTTAECDILYKSIGLLDEIRRRDGSDTLAQVLTEEPDWGQVPAKVRRLLQACRQRNPQQRLHAIDDAKLLLEEDGPPVEKRSLSQRLLHWV